MLTAIRKFWQWATSDGGLWFSAGFSWFGLTKAIGASDWTAAIGYVTWLLVALLLVIVVNPWLDRITKKGN